MAVFDSTRFSKIDLARFWSYVAVQYSHRACWEWRGPLRTDGYGGFNCDLRQYTAHRLSWEIWNGEVPPPDLVVRHKCDNVLCCNPEHLELGTHADNVADRVRRGRSALGERNGRAKLNAEQARHVMALTGVRSVTSLARSFGVDPKVIRQIWNGETWRQAIAGQPQQPLPRPIATQQAG